MILTGNTIDIDDKGYYVVDLKSSWKTGVHKRLP
jgi:hypothetical protein